MRTIHRYVLREMVVPFGLGLAVFTFILLVARILKLVDMVLNRGVPPLEVLKIFSFILPAFLEVTVPMALLLSVLVAFGRLSADSEITALKTSGVSLYQLMRPVAAFALCIYAISLWVSLYARPWGNNLLRTALYEIAKVRASAGIKEKVFNDDFAGLVIYVDRIEPPGNALRGILIADVRNPSERNTVFARLGYLVPNEAAHALTLRLLDGNVHASYPQDRTYHWTDFATYDITLDLNVALAKLHRRDKDPSEMTIRELRSAIDAKRTAGELSGAEDVELHRKFSIPFACLAFAALGVPLGIQPGRSVRSRGFMLSLAVIFSYYLVLSLGESLGQRSVLPAAVALWFPNLMLAVLATVLFVRSARETAVSGRWRPRASLAAGQRRIAAVGKSRGS